MAENIRKLKTSQNPASYYITDYFTNKVFNKQHITETEFKKQESDDQVTFANQQRQNLEEKLQMLQKINKQLV